MIKVENLSYGYAEKELFNKISFEISSTDHIALIGSNGAGKSTLLDIITDKVTGNKDYLYDGKITIDPEARIGYASQFKASEKAEDITVFEYLAKDFMLLNEEIEKACDALANASDMEKALEDYQALLDKASAIDIENYEANIYRTLHTAKMSRIKDYKIDDVSGGEFKVLQVMRQMLKAPNLLLLDEPDAFLDFANINALTNLINSYPSGVVVVTHNRFLLEHCFNRIMNLENGDLDDYMGTYAEYRCWILREKLRLKKLSIDDEKEIERTQQMVEILRDRATDMVNPVIGKSVHAKQSQLDRLKARQIKAPFIQMEEPEIHFTIRENEETQGDAKVILQAPDFTLKAGEKVAIVGSNGAGKTTIIKQILEDGHPDISIADGVNYALLTQTEDAKNISGGEQGLKKLQEIAKEPVDLLILDEPTSHLDVYAQRALEKALKEYKGTVLMVSHDFYLITQAADYVLYTEDGQLTRMRSRKFRKMVYDKYFSPEYFELDRKKQEIEQNIIAAYIKEDLDKVEKLCGDMENV